MQKLYVEKAPPKRLTMTHRIPDSIPVILTIGGAAVLLVENHLEEAKQILAVVAIILGIVIQIAKYFRDRKLKKEIEHIKVDRSLTKEVLNQRIAAIEAKLNDN